MAVEHSEEVDRRLLLGVLTGRGGAAAEFIARKLQEGGINSHIVLH